MTSDDRPPGREPGDGPGLGDRDRQPETTTERVGATSGRLASQLMVGVGLLLAIAVVKPWGGGGAAPAASRVNDLGAVATNERGSGSDSGRPPSPLASEPGLAAYDADATPCMSANGERFVTLIRTAGQEVRSWQLTDGAVSSSPLDPSVAAIRVLSPNVVGLGLCTFSPDQVSPASDAGELVDVRVMSESRPGIFVDLGVPPRITTVVRPRAAILYGPPAFPAAASLGPDPSGSPMGSNGPTAAPTWPAGTFILGFRVAQDDGALRWLRVRIEPAVGIFG